MLDRIQRLIATIRGVTENIAHDLRTPLNRLRGRLEVALMSPRLEEEYRAVLKRAIAETETIVETFNGILKIARIKAAALAGGLALSFTAIGLFVATLGFEIGLDGDVFRIVAAILLIVIGVVLAAPSLQEKVSAAASLFGNWAQKRFGGSSSAGVSGQFGAGLLLGAIWSPCAGPTLGAASVLASHWRRWREAALVPALPCPTCDFVGVVVGREPEFRASRL